MNPDSDHTRSTFLTDAAGQPYQFIIYLPFGETFTKQRAAEWATPYRFNAKELDEETGLYYYGARYYDPRVSMWWGVDPLAGEMPAWSPYAYTFQNPVRYIDPTGMFPEEGGDPPGSNLPVVFVTATPPEKKKDGPIKGISQAFGAIPDLFGEYNKRVQEIIPDGPKKVERTGAFGTNRDEFSSGTMFFKEGAQGGGTGYAKDGNYVDLNELVFGASAIKAALNPLKSIPSTFQYGVDGVDILMNLKDVHSDRVNSAVDRLHGTSFERKKVCIVCGDTLDLDAPQKFHVGFDTIRLNRPL